MRKIILTLVGAAAAAATIGGAALATADTAAASAQDQTITLKATTVSVTCIPVPGQKMTGQEVPGDQCVFAEKLTRNGASYGHDAIHCTVATLNDLVCTAAWMLPGSRRPVPRRRAVRAGPSTSRSRR
jgi:type 1 fimbria pilin